MLVLGISRASLWGSSGEAWGWFLGLRVGVGLTVSYELVQLCWAKLAVMPLLPSMSLSSVQPFNIIIAKLDSSS